MKGTIRIVLGLLMVFGGVGGIEQDVTTTLPMQPLLIAIFGLILMAWGTYACNKEESKW